MNHQTIVEGENFKWNYDDQISAVYFNTAYYFTDSFGMQIGARFEDQDKHSIIDYNENIDCSSLGQIDCESSGFCDWDNGNGTCDENLFKSLLNNLGNGDVPYEHTRVYPTLYFMYDTQGSGNIKFEFGRRINRPWHRALDPIPEF